MTTAAITAIANHLNIAEGIIASVEEWAHVLFVRFIGRRPRFVSKKVLEMSANEWQQVPVSSGNSCEIAQWVKGNMEIVQHKNSGFWASKEVSIVHYPAWDETQPEVKTYQHPLLRPFATLEDAIAAIEGDM